MHSSIEKKRRGGFTLIEFAVVVVIIGVLAAFGVPRFLKSVERSKAAEAFSYLTAVRSAQERIQSKSGRYTADLTVLAISSMPPEDFLIGTIQPGSSGSLEDSWTVTLTRVGSAGGYGDYTVVFTQDGYDVTNSTIQRNPDISPLGL